MYSLGTPGEMGIHVKTVNMYTVFVCLGDNIDQAIILSVTLLLKQFVPYTYMGSDLYVRKDQTCAIMLVF